ncbi:unnamed protein product, partial [Prorocentrum cordatum]
MFGDVSDPYVVVRVGAEHFRTPSIDNDLDPVWDRGNEFSFTVDPSPQLLLQLEVMNANVFRDDLLGSTSLALGSLPPGQPTRRRVKLDGCPAGELEFEVQLGGASYAWTAGRATAQGSGPKLEYQLGPEVRQPRSWALALEGVRVLELTRRTWAAPLCGRMLAASGADVVRVAFGEEAEAVRKKSGGVLRPQPDAHRASADRAKSSSAPRVLHAGKRQAPHHPGDEQEMAHLRAELLPGCDLLLTDLPADELDQMQLGFRPLREQFPGMIYAHVSSIGILADSGQRGVEDSGAFYCLTGLAEQLGHFLGPAGFAAATAAPAMFGVLCLAVMRRRCGTPGDRVELSLFRTGRWCTAVGACTKWARPPQVDSRFGAWAPLGAQPAPAVPFDVEGAALLQPGEGARRAAALEPMHLRWRDCDPALRFPPPQAGSPLASELPLSRVSVIEISDEYHVSAAALGSMLADLGAQVTKVERASRPDPWKRTCPALYHDLNSKKAVQDLDFTTVPGQAAVYRTLADTTALVTNLPAQALEAWGLGVERLREMFPHLVVVQVGDPQEAADARKGGQEVHAFWEASGLAARCFNNLGMPPGLSELATSLHALGGACLALLRQQRTGSGQLVHVGRHQAALFSRDVAELQPPAPLASPLLSLQDGRYMRLLGRGHSAHDAWALLHATGQRGSLWDHVGGSHERARAHLGAHSEEDLRRQREELVAGAARFAYDDLAKAFLSKGIDWFVEELRPVDAEALHKARAAQAEDLKERHRAAVEKVLRVAEGIAELEERMREAVASQQRQLREGVRRTEEGLRLEAEKREKIALHEQNINLLRQQHQQGIPPIVTVTLVGAQYLHAVNTERPNSYCVCEVPGKPFTQFRSRTVAGSPSPEWHDCATLRGYLNGDRLSFRVFHTDPDASAQASRHANMLCIRINGAHNLKNTETGFMSGVSDPYVIARIGSVEKRTPTIENNLNPVWTHDHEFEFELEGTSPTLLLMVMNENVGQMMEGYRADDCIGRCEINPLELPKKQWTHKEEHLEDGDGGVLEFEVFYSPPVQEHDELLGAVELDHPTFAFGYSGTLSLYGAHGDTGSKLHVAVDVAPAQPGTMPTRDAGIPPAPQSQPGSRPGSVAPAGTPPPPQLQPGSSPAGSLARAALSPAQSHGSPAGAPSDFGVGAPSQRGAPWHPAGGGLPEQGRPPGTLQRVDSRASSHYPHSYHAPSVAASDLAGRGPPVQHGATWHPAGGGIPEDERLSGSPQTWNPGQDPMLTQYSRAMSDVATQDPMLTRYDRAMSDVDSVMTSPPDRQRQRSARHGAAPPRAPGGAASSRPPRRPDRAAAEPPGRQLEASGRHGMMPPGPHSAPPIAGYQAQSSTWGPPSPSRSYGNSLPPPAPMLSPAAATHSRGSVGSHGTLAPLAAAPGPTGGYGGQTPARGRHPSGPTPGAFSAYPAASDVGSHGRGSPPGSALPAAGPAPRPCSSRGSAPPGAAPPAGPSYSRGSEHGFAPPAAGPPAPGPCSSQGSLQHYPGAYGTLSGTQGTPAGAPLPGPPAACGGPRGPDGSPSPAQAVDIRPGDAEAAPSLVTVWIRGARNLRNLDTGIMGDLSDPYVAVSVGKSQEQKTPTINNNLNPAWSSGNQFTFPVTLEDPVLRLRVMNHNYTKDQSLGEAEVDLRVMQYGRVCQFREPLREGQGAELEFDVEFRPTEYFLTVLESTSKLYLRVNGALGLKNTDTGLYNPVTGTRDLSDPYVVATVGRQQHKTPTIDDTLDPVWESFNSFTFSVGDDEHELRLEVFNENNSMRRDDSIGFFVLDLRYIPHNVWVPHREKLQAAPGELEFDVYFGPTEYYSLSCQLAQAKAEQARCAAEATRLSKEVQMAEYANEWLEDIEGMTKMPLSIVEKDWEHACGGRNLVIPAWIAVTSAQVQSLERRRSQHPQRVSLFPEAEASGRPPPRLRVRILGAFDLSAASGDQPSAYCVCE